MHSLSPSNRRSRDKMPRALRWLISAHSDASLVRAGGRSAAVDHSRSQSLRGVTLRHVRGPDPYKHPFEKFKRQVCTGDHKGAAAGDTVHNGRARCRRCRLPCQRKDRDQCNLVRGRLTGPIRGHASGTRAGSEAASGAEGAAISSSSTLSAALLPRRRT